MKKVIVTGGAGFIGSTLVDKLIDDGLDVIVLDNLSTGKESNINPKAEFIKCDVSKDRPLFNDVDTVFHLAATPQVQHSIENPTDNNNLDSVINMLNISKKSGVKRFIFTSSSAVYGNPEYTPIDENHPTNPLSPYALHKLVGEQYCKLYSDLYGLDTISLRYFNAYGERMSNEGAYKSVISVFNEQHKKKEPLNIVNDGEQKRDFIHVNDIVKANLICGFKKDKPFNGEIYNVGSGVAYSVNEIADMFGGEKKYGEKRIEPKNSIAETAKINLDLDWESTESLSKFIFTKVNK
jgi:UDP-glucose 4-epimerase